MARYNSILPRFLDDNFLIANRSTIFSAIFEGFLLSGSKFITFCITMKSKISMLSQDRGTTFLNSLQRASMLLPEGTRFFNSCGLFPRSFSLSCGKRSVNWIDQCCRRSARCQCVFLTAGSCLRARELALPQRLVRRLS